jgi:alkanesulfonate monooxygenase SsuD/methylene tetrahydromethanopterin reductase-like flavin-dependent oxidoreductase (luciferase family)
MEDSTTGDAPSWSDFRAYATAAEAAGFDIFWVPDELLWESADGDGASGWWECVALCGAVASATDTIQIGTWVLSALHRNPALSAKAATTLDEISDGRFVFGFGAGHSARQGEAFGYPPDRIVSRYEEALAIVVDLLRTGSSDRTGTYHSTARLDHRPAGPRPTGIPLLLAGHGPRNIRLAVTHGDYWSGYATTSSQPEAFMEMMALVERTCEEVGRDPASIGRSIGIAVAPPGRPATGFWEDGDPVMGSLDEIVDTLGRFADMGVTRLEIMAVGDQLSAIEELAPVVAAVNAGS